MTETEWLDCTDPKPMLQLLWGKASDRKVRLFAASLCRNMWDLLTDERSRVAVEVLERFADGEAAAAELAPAAQDAYNAGLELEMAGDLCGWPAAISAGAGPEAEGHERPFAVQIADAWGNAISTAFSASFAVGIHHPAGCADARDARMKAEEAAGSDLLRDISGSPFRPVTLDPACLTPGLISLARAAYENRLLPSGHLDPDRLAVLSDALEEAGCQDAAILGHLRGEGPHVRGCWVIDLLTGRE